MNSSTRTSTIRRPARTTIGGVSNEAVRLRRPDWLLALLLVIVTFVTYEPAWRGTPIWDDDAHLTKPELRSLEGLARIWTQPGATVVN